MKTLSQNEFISILCDEKNQLLKAIWKEKSEEMDEERFKEINLLYLEYIEKYDVKGFMIDTGKFLFVISPELQTWVVENIISNLSIKGLRKLAMLTSEEFIAQLSIEQTMEEAPELHFSLAYFSEEEEANKWILS